MKKILLLNLIFLNSIVALIAQTPIVFNYQAVVRDTSNQPFKNQPAHLEARILDNSNLEVYSDEHDVITTTLGVFNIQIGNGSNKMGDLSTINWETGGPFFLHVTIKVGSTDPKTYALTPSQLVFVPNAFYAIQASKSRTLDGFSAGQGIEITANKVSNTGVLKVLAGTGVSVQGTDTTTISNAGVLALNAGTGILLGGSQSNPEIINDGILKSTQAGGQLKGTFSDLSIANLNAKNGDVLQYDQPSQKWIPGASVPIGSIMPFAGSQATVPAGWLLCDGQEKDRNGVFSGLFSVIGTLWGSGNGSTTFSIPDMRGVFMRGVSYSSPNNYDPQAGGRSPIGTGAPNEVGSFQGDELKSHTHGLTNGNAVLSNNGGNNLTTQGGGNFTYHDISVQNSGGSETRPKNVYVNYIIKY